MVEESEWNACEYVLRPDGIHEFTFREGSRRSVDIWLDKTEEIFPTLIGREWARFLIDGSNIDSIPMAYAYPRLKALTKNYPNRPPTRGVILYRHGVLIPLIEAFAKLAGRGTEDDVRFIHVSKREEAIQWLLEEE